MDTYDEHDPVDQEADPMAEVAARLQVEVREASARVRSQAVKLLPSAVAGSVPRSGREDGSPD